MDNFDPYNVFLAIATNIPQQFKTGFVLQGHICAILLICRACFVCFIENLVNQANNYVCLCNGSYLRCV